MDLNGLRGLWKGHRQKEASTATPKRPWASRWLLSFFALNLGVLSFFGGRSLAGALLTLDPVFAGVAAMRLPLALGLAGALWDGGCIVKPTPFRPFFLKDQTLMLGEGLLGLTTPVKRILAAMGAAYTLGLTTLFPRLLPWGLLTVLLGLLWVVCLERILHALPLGRLLRQKAILLLVGVLGGTLIALHRLAGHGWPHLQLASALERVWSLPGIRLLQAGQQILGGHGIKAMPLLFLPLIATLLLLTVACISVRAQFGSPRPAQVGLGSGHTWAFRHPRLAVAWVQFHQLLGSRAGQLRLLMLLLSIPLAKEPELLTVGHLATPMAWTFGACAITFGAILVIPLCNQLGFDRGGVRTWWLLPLQDRDLWLGKVLGVAAYAGLALPILLLLISRTQQLRLKAIDGMEGLELALEANGGAFTGLQVLALGLLMGTLFLWWAGSGFRRSLAGSEPLGPSNYAVKLDFDDEKLARIGVLLGPIVWMLPLFGLAAMLSPWALIPLVALFAAIAWSRFLRKLDQACEALEAQREEVSNSLAQLG